LIRCARFSFVPYTPIIDHLPALFLLQNSIQDLSISSNSTQRIKPVQMKKGTIFKKALLDDRQAYLNIKEGRLNEWEASLVAREAHLALHSGQQGTSETGVAVKQEEDVFEEKPAMSSGGEGKKRASRAKQVRKFKVGHLSPPRINCN